MKQTLFLLLILSSLMAFAQKPAASTGKALPPTLYRTMHDSCTGLDITFLTGHAGSMSMDGRNVRPFTSFISQAPAAKKADAVQDGVIMWEIDGREFISGKIYLTSDSAGYIVYNKNNAEYVNALTPAGAGFLKKQSGK